MRERTGRIGGVASTGIATLLTGTPRSGHVLAVTPAAAYLVFPRDDDGTHPNGQDPVPMVALEAHGSVGLPLAVGLPADAGQTLAGLRPGAPAHIGHGHLDVADLHLRVARWRDPRPALAPIDAPVLAGRAQRAAPRVPAPDDPSERRVVDLTHELAREARRGDPDAALAAADAMLGLGPGSTPAGDDVLAGFVAAGQVLAAATTRWAGPDQRWFHRLGAAVTTFAPRRTPALSAALLWHAARGHVATPAGSLLRALTGRADVALAMAALCAVGHSSGAHLARGILTAARLATDHDIDHDPSARPQGSHHARTPGGPSRRLPRLRQPAAGQPAGR